MSSASLSELNFFSITLLCAAIQGYFLALALFLRNYGNPFATRLLACLLLIISLNLSDFVISNTYLARKLPHLVATTKPLAFLIGPLFYLYVRSLLSGTFHLNWKKSIHLAPAVLVVMVLLPFYWQTAEAKITYLHELDQMPQVDIPLVDIVYSAIGLSQLGIYFCLSYYSLRRHERRLKQATSNVKIINISWLKRFSFLLSLFLLGYLLTFTILVLTKVIGLKVSMPDLLALSLANLLVLSLFIYTVGYATINHPEAFAILSNGKPAQKYQRSTLSRQQSRIYIARPTNMMESEKPYLQNDLHLSDLAERLSVSSHHLSQVINQELGLNFFDFVNEYRIKEVKQRLLNPDFRHLTMLAIAFDVGFRNKASFNRVFKKHTGLTPSLFVSSTIAKPQPKHPLV